MGNPIAKSTEAFLATLAATVREAAEEAVSANSRRMLGVELSLTEEVNLAKAIKQLASVDGFSREERSALEYLMIMSGIPHRIQQDVLDFDVTNVFPEHVAELFPKGSRKAAYVLSGAIAVAAFDGLSEDEEMESRDLGVHLGLPQPLIEDLIDNAHQLGLAMSAGDRAKVGDLEYERRKLIDRI
ncbi:MAG: hypothetical protein KDK70_00350 [Myxococcales bacterium]|nr:hypothetical protein [Myxococcales bacterium]